MHMHMLMHMHMHMRMHMHRLPYVADVCASLAVSALWALERGL